MLKYALAASLTLALTFTAQAQKMAITSDGETVVLYNDGTWRYEDEGSRSTGSRSIATNPTTFTKGANSTFLIRSKRVPFGIYIDPRQWSFEKVEGGDGEFEFELRGEDLYGLIITEKVPIPLESLRNIAIENGLEAAPDLEVVEEEYRTVNGNNMLMMRMDGTIQGIPFSYYGYYFSNEHGTIQFLTYTAQSLMGTYQREAEKLLNGFVVL